MGLADTLKSFDGHSSVSREFRVYTIYGAIFSMFTLFAIAYLVGTEFVYNFQTHLTERVHVNETSTAGIEMEFDISFLDLPCARLNIDANDPNGQPLSLHLDREHHVWKHRVIFTDDGTMKFKGDKTKLELGSTLLSEDHLRTELEPLATTTNETSGDDDDDDDDDTEPKADECGSCYGAGAEGECCNTCDDVKRAYSIKGWVLQDLSSIEQCKQDAVVVIEPGEGCNIHGVIALSSGGGNVHLAPGRAGSGASDGRAMSLVDMVLQTFQQFNVSHTIHKIRFGREFPGHVHQLDSMNRIIEDTFGMYQYYFQIVPTSYRFLNGTTIQTNQYSVTEHLRHVNPGSGRGLPGVFFFYEVSPLHVEMVEEYKKGWIAFMTSVCAVVGGVVTVMGMFDQLIFRSSQRERGGLVR